MNFGRSVLNQIGYTRGVFHIEARERSSDRKLCLIEVNPRSPGGALWRSAMLRTGYDCERIDIMIQLGIPLVFDDDPDVKRYALHVPFYANSIGKLANWGQIESDSLKSRGWDWIEFHQAATLGADFSDKSMVEEPYLAFLVAHGNSIEEIFSRIDLILGLDPPTIAQQTPRCFIFNIAKWLGFLN